MILIIVRVIVESLPLRNDSIESNFVSAADRNAIVVAVRNHVKLHYSIRLLR